MEEDKELAERINTAKAGGRVLWAGLTLEQIRQLGEVVRLASSRRKEKDTQLS